MAHLPIRRSRTLRQKLQNTRGLQTIEMIMIAVGAIIVVSLIISVATGSGGFGDIMKSLLGNTQGHVDKTAPQ